jgi:hypothetical protein
VDEGRDLDGDRECEALAQERSDLRTIGEADLRKVLPHVQIENLRKVDWPALVVQS